MYRLKSHKMPFKISEGQSKGEFSLKGRIGWACYSCSVNEM